MDYSMLSYNDRKKIRREQDRQGCLRFIILFGAIILGLICVSLLEGDYIGGFIMAGVMLIILFILGLLCLKEWRRQDREE
jgi:uncharacterized membrane protein YoaK (UPF0700 family)